MGKESEAQESRLGAWVADITPPSSCRTSGCLPSVSKPRLVSALCKVLSDFGAGVLSKLAGSSGWD